MVKFKSYSAYGPEVDVSAVLLQMKGSVADNDGRLQPADQIIGLNGKDLLSATREQIAELLKVCKNVLAGLGFCRFFSSYAGIYAYK